MRLATVVCCLCLPLFAQATLVDIKPGNGSSNPIEFVEYNGLLFFSADNGTSGAELWKSDGTPGGTSMVLDINPGASPSSPANLTVMGGSLYFTATDGTHGVELWKTGGTPGTTVMVADLAVGAGSSTPQFLTVFNNELYFSATNGIPTGVNAIGVELYKSDGTTITLVKDIAFSAAGGAANGNPSFITISGSPARLFFAATDGINGVELWSSDGTTVGTNLVSDIRPGVAASSPANLANVNGLLYFTADDGVHGVELWQSDGTAGGTVLTADINPGIATSTPASLTASHGILLFAADNGGNGLELWKAVPGGAVSQVKDVRPGNPGSGITNMVDAGGTVYFRAQDGTNGSELWKSDGSTVGTVMVSDINPGSGGSNPSNLTSITTSCGAGLMFSANGGGPIGVEPFHTNGTAATTLLVADINPGNGNANPSGYRVAGNRIFFQAQDGSNGNELWSVPTSIFGDTTPPVVTGCPANITVNAAAGLCSANVSWTPPTASDNCTLASFTTDHGPGSSFPVGTTTVTYTAVDGASLTATCSFTVTVNDAQPPVFSNCAPNASANGSATCLATLPDLRGGVVVADNCGAVTITQSPAAGTVLNLGPHTITFTATDTHANSSTCTSTFTVLDVTAPVISLCASNAQGVGGLTCQAAIPDLRGGVVASDGCGAVTITQTPAPGTLLGFGPHPVAFTVADAANNTTSCASIFTVLDVVPPSVTSCAQNAQGSAGANCQAAIPDLRGGVVASDNCGAVTVTQSPVAGTVLALGPHPVLFTITDGSANTNTCSMTYTVVDTTPPSITTCPGNAQANANAACQATVPDLRPALVATDNCSAVTVTQSPAGGSLTGVGPHTITFTVTDAASNSSTCTATFTVIDVTPPVITACAGSQQSSANTSCQAGVPDLRSGVVASDTCGAVTITQSPAPGTLVGIGPHTVTFTVTDPSSNASTCTATFTVADTTAPVVSSCGANTQANASASCQAAVPDLRSGVVATDNCGLVTVTQSPVAGTLTGLGPHTITFTVTDGASNASTCTRTFTVVDATPPVITTCVSNTSASAGATCQAAMPDLRAGVVATDNCGTVTITQSPLPGTLQGIGPHTVTFTAADGASNTATCTATFTVLDTTPPAITSCTAGTQATAGATCHATVPDLRSGVVATDNCSAVVVTQSPAAGSVANLGANTITFTVTDASSNGTTCTTTFTVVDLALPTIVCPANVTVSSIPGQCIATGVSLGSPTVSDNCGILSVTNTAPPVFFAGTTPVTWFVTDTSGHVATCTQLVTVVALPPVITVPPTPQNGVIGAPVTFSVTATGIGSLTYQWRHDGTPISGATASSYTIGSVAPGSAGLYSVTLTDACGQQLTSTPVALNIYDLLFSLSQPFGTGSLGIVNSLGVPGASYFSAFSVDPANGSNPGAGFWFGLEITVNDLITQFLAGGPPFVGVLDPAGGSAFILPPGTVTPALTGITLYGVSATFNPATFTPTGHSNVAAVTFQ